MSTIYIPVTDPHDYRRSHIDIILSVMGTFVCFLTDIMLPQLWQHSNNNILLSVFCPVNSSVWESAKVIFIVMLLWYAAEYFIMHVNFNRMAGSALGGLTTAMLCRICLVILINGIIAPCGNRCDMCITLLSIAFGMRSSVAIGRYPGRVEEYALWYAAGFGVLLYAVLSFSVNPPHIGLFLDPVSGGFGFR